MKKFETTLRLLVVAGLVAGPAAFARDKAGDDFGSLPGAGGGSSVISQLETRPSVAVAAASVADLFAVVESDLTEADLTVHQTEQGILAVFHGDTTVELDEKAMAERSVSLGILSGPIGSSYLVLEADGLRSGGTRLQAGQLSDLPVRRLRDSGMLDDQLVVHVFHSLHPHSTFALRSAAGSLTIVQDN